MSAVTPAPEAPAVKLPKAVQNQMEKVRQMEASLKEEFNKKTPTGAQVVEPNPVVENPKAVVQAVQPTVTPEVKVEDAKDSKYWEHRFKTLQGMAEAEKMKLKNHISGLESRLADMEETLKSLKAKPSDSAPVDLTKYLSQEEIDSYGADVIKAVVKTAKTAANEETTNRYREELKREVEPLKQKLNLAEEDIRRRTENQFWTDLDKNYPNWLAVNEDPKWREWLSHRDPITGHGRQELLDAAQNALDVNRVVAMFTAFTQSSPAPQLVASKESQVVPEPIATPINMNAQDNAPFVTRADIKKFYNEKAIGKYRFRPQEAEAMEKRINAAIKAGNVR